MLNFKKLITKTTNDGRAEVLEELLEAKKNKLKEFPLEGGLDKLVEDLAKTNTETTWIGLLKLQKLILEIRYLERNGDATVECDLETATGDPFHIKGLVGTATTNGTVDQRIVGRIGLRGEEHYLVEYFREFAWVNNELDANAAINKIKNGEDDLLEGIEFEKKLDLYHKHFEARDLILGLSDTEKTLKKSIKEELDKNTPETDQVWRNKLKDIDASLNDPVLINDAWKDKWSAIDKFKKADEVKALFNKVKGKADFFTEVSGTTTDWKTLVTRDPASLIKSIIRYELNQFPDSDPDEKKKEKTQMKRRIAKQEGKTKVEDLTDEEINEALFKDATGKKVIDRSKFYDASLQEITTKKPEPHEETKKPFLRWNNPWVYSVGTLAIGIVGVIIFWDKLVNLFSGEEENN